MSTTLQEKLIEDIRELHDTIQIRIESVRARALNDLNLESTWTGLKQIEELQARERSRQATLQRLDSAKSTVKSQRS